jgi:hypothetical protein
MPMWAYLQGLPSSLSVTILIIAVLSFVIISLKGAAVIKWDKRIIGLGKAKLPPDSDIVTKPKYPKDYVKDTSPPTTSIYKKLKRGCGDCILILIGEREKYELNIRKTYNRILKQQMNYVEQKLTEVQTLFSADFMECMHSMTGKSNEDTYETQYKLYYGLLRDSLVSAKDEFRRSFKENGFFELSDSDFTTYVKDKTKNLISLLIQHTRNMYPSRGVVVSAEHIINIYDKNLLNLQEVLFSIYATAKQVTAESDVEINDLKTQYAKWVDDFVN